MGMTGAGHTSTRFERLDSCRGFAEEVTPEEVTPTPPCIRFPAEESIAHVMIGVPRSEKNKTPS